MSNLLNVHANLDLIKLHIESLQKHKNVSRRVSQSDLTERVVKRTTKKDTNESKVRDYRMQEEHGEKKFIKP